MPLSAATLRDLLSVIVELCVHTDLGSTVRALAVQTTKRHLMSIFARLNYAYGALSSEDCGRCHRQGAGTASGRGEDKHAREAATRTLLLAGTGAHPNHRAADCTS